MESYKKGDAVIYTSGDKKELGIVKRPTEDGAFVFYHRGGTSGRTYDRNLQKVNISDVSVDDISNKFAFDSLVERQRRILNGQPESDWNDLIDI